MISESPGSDKLPYLKFVSCSTTALRNVKLSLRVQVAQLCRSDEITSGFHLEYGTHLVCVYYPATLTSHFAREHRQESYTLGGRLSSERSGSIKSRV